jgi:hypothetical protein
MIYIILTTKYSSLLIKSLQIQVMELRRKKRLDGVDELFVFDLRKEVREGTHQHHACGLGIAQLPRYFLSVDDMDILFEVFLECLLHSIRVCHLSQAHCGW